MNSPEVFYVHMHGEQRGPYTIRHIDHLLNSGLIREEAMYWREGMEQWAPVTDLVRLRRPERRWRRMAVGGAVALVVGVLLLLFGPAVVDGWREIYQHEFTPRAAYWRARDVVRTQGLPRHAVVTFKPRAQTEVRLGEGEATVILQAMRSGSGEVVDAAWRVRLRFDAESREWSALECRELELEVVQEETSAAK